jgi:hypothetical protein
LIAPPTNIQSYTGPFVGSKNSNVYHYPWCYEAKKILPENLVTFATVADACAAGYRPCEVCNPPACNPTPSPTPTPQPVTGYFGQSNYVIANGTVVTAYVSNWQSNPSVAMGSPAHGSSVPMQPIGNGWYTLTLEGVIILNVPNPGGHGVMSLVDNGKQIATATTTWEFPSPTPTPLPPAPEPTATPVIIRGG